MGLQLGDTAPDFTQVSTMGPIRFYDWAGDSWVVLFSHPKDFTPVCTTELGEISRLKLQFDRRNVKVIGLSVDPLDDHRRWATDIEETQGYALNFPLLADSDRRVADLYGMIHPNANDTLTVRSVFVIDPNRKVRLMITYPASTGRNFEEIIRVIDSLQLTDQYKVATPANWHQDDDVIIVPSVTDEEAKDRFPEGWTTVKPYLRVVHQPGPSVHGARHRARRLDARVLAPAGGDVVMRYDDGRGGRHGSGVCHRGASRRAGTDEARVPAFQQIRT